ncbi:MAG: ABC transporter substrate-binding protein [Thermoanaerobaculia bacterium]|nr:ABC transporter substrate-binding protein [Thermoanaerobaculia bacterium]
MNEQAKKVLRVGVVSGISTLDPRLAADGTTSMVLRQVFEPTIEIVSAFTSPEPRLFSSFESDPSNRIFKGKIREDLKFSDGTPLDVEIVVRSLNKTDVVTQRARVEAAGGDTVVFTLDEPHPNFDILLSMSHCAVVHDQGNRLLGTGAFMLEEGTTARDLESTGTIRLVRNPHYDGLVWLDEIVFSYYPTDQDGRASRLLGAMEKGEVDLTIDLTSSDAHDLDLSKFHPSIQPGNSLGFLFFNVERITDVRHRRAIALALDRAKVAEKSFDRNPIAYVGRNVLPPMMSRDPEMFSLSRREAEKLFEEAGRPGSLSMIIPWAPRPYAPNPRPMAEEIAAQLKECEIEIDIVSTSSGEDFFTRAGRGEFDLAMAGWIADSPDPADFLLALFHSTSVPKGSTAVSSINLARYRDPEMDRALAEYRLDPSEENKKTVLDLATENVVLVPLVTSQNVAVYSRRVRNFRPSPAGAPVLVKIDLD